MILGASLYHHIDTLTEHLSEVRRTLGLLNAPETLNEQQALVLAAAALELRPDVILDLGTGSANSAAIFALTGAPLVYTYDLHPSWKEIASTKLRLESALLSRVTPIVGDITQVDFAPMVQKADRVLVFWDAHGHDIAARVLGHLMPLIADKRHLVICHDIGDRRYIPEEYKSYNGKRLWQGLTDWSDETTSFGIVNWACTIVDQSIPIFDFCWRNDTEFRSVDHDFFAVIGDQHRETVAQRFDLDPAKRFSIGYFTLDGTKTRNFPSPAVRGALRSPGLMPAERHEELNPFDHRPGATDSVETAEPAKKSQGEFSELKSLADTTAGQLELLRAEHDTTRQRLDTLTAGVETWLLPTLAKHSAFVARRGHTSRVFRDWARAVGKFVPLLRSDRN
jgi:hypothetical protein